MRIITVGLCVMKLGMLSRTQGKTPMNEEEKETDHAGIEDLE